MIAAIMMLVSLLEPRGGNVEIRGGQAGNLQCPAPGAHGGDIRFVPGKGSACSALAGNFDGDIIFMLANGQEMLRLRHDGAVVVRRKVARKDGALVKAFAEWLHGASGAQP